MNENLKKARDMGVRSRWWIVVAGMVLGAWNQALADGGDLGLQFAPDGGAILQNSQLAVQVNNKTSRVDGIRGWKYKPTGYEMVDVLFRNLDTGGGHLLGLIWDNAAVGTNPFRVPDVGGLFVPLFAGLAKDGRAVVLEQVAQGKYRLTRTMILRRDCATVEVRFRLENIGDDPAGFALRLQNVLSPGARGEYASRDEVVTVPAKEGVLEWRQNLPMDQFNKAKAGFVGRADLPDAGTSWQGKAVRSGTPQLAGDWLAQWNPQNGDGMAILIDQDLRGYYNAPGATVEPVFKAVALRKGESWETKVFMGAFGGAKGHSIQGMSPLYVVLNPLAITGGILRGEVIPMFAGRLKVVSTKDPSGQLAEYDARAMTPIQIEVKAPADWQLVAQDRQGGEIGRVSPDGTVSFYEPEISRETKQRPRVTEAVYQKSDAESDIRAAIQARDFVVQCDWSESEAIRALAEKIALHLGVGLAWTPRYSGKMLAFGSPERSATVRNAGLLKQSVDAGWPGAGHGAILQYANFESTAKPLILVAGSDDAGALAAAQAFYNEYVKDIPEAKGFDFWASPVSELGMVWSRPVTATVLKQIDIQSAHNEYESAQVILTPYENLSNVEVTVDPLINEASGKPISEQFDTPYRKRFGPIRVRWAESYPLNAADGWPGTPDPLLSRPVTELPAGHSQVLWLTTLVADDAEPGMYRSAIHVKANGESRSIPIELKVHDFTLPVTGLKGEAYMAMDLMSPTRRLRATELERLISSLVEHRFRIISINEPDLIRWHVSPEGKFKGIDVDSLYSNADGTLLMDTSRFDWIQEKCDQVAKPAELEYYVSLLDVIGWPDAISAFQSAFPNRYTDKPKRDGQVIQNYYTQEMLGMFEKHLEQRGLEKRVSVKVGDEPPGFQFWWDNCVQAALHAGVQFWTAFNNFDGKEAEKSLGTKLNHFEPLYQQFDPDFARKAQKAGQEVGWYNCGPPPRIGVGTPASELRSYYWQAAKYNLDFVSRWGVQCWGSEGTTPATVWTYPFGHHNFLVYPEHPNKPPYHEKDGEWVDTAPLDSIRYELVRDGIEDADYVRVLRALIDQARKEGYADAAQKAEAVLDEIWKDMFPTMLQFDPPYADLMAARSRVADAIESLQKIIRPNSMSERKAGGN